MVIFADSVALEPKQSLLLVQAQRRSKKGSVEPEDPYKEFKDESLDAAEARSMLHNVNAAINLAADLFDRVSLLTAASLVGCVVFQAI